MAINIKHYVDITSGVGGATLAPTRKLVGRFFTDSNLVPTGAFLSFSSAAEVIEYFGASAEEAKRASFYFAWVSKNITRPQSIQFARYTPDGAPPTLISASINNSSLGDFTTINAGAFNLTIGDTALVLTGINLSGASSLSNVATIITDAIINTLTPLTLSGDTTASSAIVAMGDTTGLSAGMIVVGDGIPRYTTIDTIVADTSITLSSPASITDTGVSLRFFDADDAMIASSLVTYDSSRGGFVFTGGASSDADVAVASPDTGDDLTGIGLLGWLPHSWPSSLGTFNPFDAIWSKGQNAQTVPETLQQSASISSDFGSFAFLTRLNLANAQIQDAAAWNSEQNAMYMYSVATIASNIVALQALLQDIDGVGITLSPLAEEYPEQAPMMIAAATNYNNVNAVQNYMYQIFNLTPSVTTTQQAQFYDNIRVNYYGATQTAGQMLSFYQRGFLQGSGNAIVDMNAYMNEVWLKDAASAKILNLFLSQTQIGADEQGRGLIITALQDVINQALNNGVISVGKQLNSNQKTFISTQTNDDLAWHQVQSAGYWLDCTIIEASPEEYQANYLLIYSKDDVVRKVDGRHILI